MATGNQSYQQYKKKRSDIINLQNDLKGEEATIQKLSNEDEGLKIKKDGGEGDAVISLKKERQRMQ